LGYTQHLNNSYLAEQNIFNGKTLNIFSEQSNEIYRHLAEYAIYKPIQKQIEQTIKEIGLSYWEVTDKLELKAIVTPILNKLESLQNDVKHLEVKQEAVGI
jgi:signal recognition particle subunit SEC65